MQPRTSWEKIQLILKNAQSKYQLSSYFVLLFIFLLVVIVVAYIVPLLDFGRFVGTDDYTHIIYTQGMDSSTGIYNFYSQMGGEASNPENPNNFYNYPFGLWLFGSLISKITGLSVMTGNFILLIFYFAIIIGSFYVYSGVFLPSKEHKLIALLFMISMPNVALILLNYRPSVFVLPFLFAIFYFALQESIDWKQVPIVCLSILIITITHTGTFMFLISFSLVFFLLYSLIWGKFSANIFITILSTFFIYLITLNWFPEISMQYEVKSTLFLAPGNFLAEKFNFFLVQDLAKLFYQNFFVGQQLIYAILFAAALYGTSKILVFIHEQVLILLSRRTTFPAVVLPIQNISHSALASPIWLGPIHVLLSIAGFFRLDGKGKCLFVTVIFTTLLPDLLHTSEGIEVATGALREISFLVVIIPITATLGLIFTLSYLKKMKNPYRTQITFIVWFCVLSVVILTPVLGSTYYLPKIAGEDYSINGMKWLGQNGQIHEKVVGYGVRTVPVFTNMSVPKVADGSETRLYRQLLQNVHFSSNDQSVNNLRQIFDVKYILSSSKILANLGRTQAGLTIDANQELDKIYSSRDFGIFEVTSTTVNSIPEYSIADDTTITKKGSEYEVRSHYYSAALDEKTPILDRFGTEQKNYFGQGSLSENIVISGQNNSVFALSNLQFSSEIENNQILYRTILNGSEGKNASLFVRYTFYPKTIKREYILSNDLLISNKSSSLTVKFSSLLFSPLSNYIITNNAGRQIRQIFQSQDTIEKTIKVEDMYIFNTINQDNAEKQGIRVKYVPSSPFPLTVYYKGSTLYSYSGITISQSKSLSSGNSLHITQFLSPGDEYGSENNILSQSGVQLNNYPDGIKPILVCGLGSYFSDDGYAILNSYGIPYSQVVSPVSGIETINEIETLPDTEPIPGTETPPETDIQSDMENPSPSSVQTLQRMDITHLTGKNVGIIGSANLRTHNYDNSTTQEKNIQSVLDYTKNQGGSLMGFMPLSFRYNLDTIKILNDKNISFLLSNPVSPTLNEGYRNPRLAYYNNEPTGIVMIPVSYPASSSLYNQDDSSVLFSQWRTIFNRTGDDDNKVIAYLFDSSDIGNPEYSSQFTDLFLLAKEKGYTFTSPDIIAEHYRQLQNIEYSGYTDMDMASINVTNNNDNMIQNVTFKVVLDKLVSGDYITKQGRIVRTQITNDTEFIYVSTDIPAHSTQNLIITPDSARKPLQIQFPKIISEGPMVITVRDAEGKPIPDAEVIFDVNFYRTGKDGRVTVNAHRGIFRIIIQSPGYEKYSKLVEVKGQLANILTMFGL